MRSREHPAGFTLIEVVVVVFLITALTAFALPRIDFVHFEVRGTAQRLSSTISAAQRTAIKRQHNVIVSFDIDRGLIRVHEDANNNREVDPGEVVRYVELGDHVVFGRVSAPEHGLIGAGTVSFNRKQDDMPAVIFGRGGNASEYGGFYLTSRRAVLTGDNRGDDFLVEIERASGRVGWLQYGDGRWVRGF